jgi:hypothetical protein
MKGKLTGQEKLAAYEYKKVGHTLVAIRTKLGREDVSIMCFCRALGSMAESFARINAARRAGDFSKLDFLEVLAAESEITFADLTEVGLPYSQARVDEARRTGNFALCRRLDEALAALSRDGVRPEESTDANANQK